jgi:pantoate--beta-alanine ligase
MHSRGERNAQVIKEAMQELIQAEPTAQLDYISIANPETLDELDLIQGHVLVSLAVGIGKTHLIDNIVLNSGGV